MIYAIIPSPYGFYPRTFQTDILKGLSSDCHREIQRRDQRLKSIQKTIFGIFCLFVGIVAYYYTHDYTKPSSVMNKEQDSDNKSSKMIPASLETASLSQRKIEENENFENDQNLQIIKFDKI